MRLPRRADLNSLLCRLADPVDGASLVVFRVLFGLLMFGGSVRFLWNGWVDRFFVRPEFFFQYWGFSWVEVLSPDLMHAAFIGLALLSLLIALGLFYRVATVMFFLLFTYVELIDVTNYLNHYYLVSLFSFLLMFTPLHRKWSLDAKLWKSVREKSIPTSALWALRFQVAVVYVFAGLAKCTSDWLLHAQPMSIWLSARTETPLIGGILDETWVAFAMSWTGCLYDLTIPLWLSLRRTRPYAFVVLLGFHFMTQVFFAIGLFPLIMTIGATLFFAPEWPRRWLRFASNQRARVMASSAKPHRVATGRMKLTALGLVFFAFLQIALPLRSLAYGGNVLWHEQGMRWSWRVMCREKNGSITYRVRRRGTNEDRYVYPSRYLTPHQEREMSGQPDLILQLAHHIRNDLEDRGYGDLEVRVDALVSLNGRRAENLIDPEVDLTTVLDSVSRAEWILPAPQGPPLSLEPTGNPS